MRFAQNNALLHRLRIEELERRRMEEHIRRLKSVQPKSLNGAGEPLVVPTSSLAPVLKTWRVRMERQDDIPYRMGDQMSGEIVTGPMQYLSEQSGLNPRQIYSIMEQRTRHCSLNKAEKLLMAIDREYMLKNGEIPTIPNPHWTFERWTEYMQRAGC